MKPRKARTQRTTYVDDANISYTTSYSAAATKNPQLKHRIGNRNQCSIGCLSRDGASCALLPVEGVCVKSGAGTRLFPVKSREGTGYTNKIANFRGTGHRIGNKAKQRTKQAKAATLQAPNTSRRSHLLTNVRKEVSVEICAKLSND